MPSSRLGSLVSASDEAFSARVCHYERARTFRAGSYRGGCQPTRPLCIMRPHSGNCAVPSSEAATLMQQVQTVGEQEKSAARSSAQLREWFLREQAIAAARREQLPPQHKAEIQAARRPTMVAKTLLDSSAETSDTSYAVLSLCREAIYWSLRVLGPETGKGKEAEAEKDDNKVGGEKNEKKETVARLEDLFAALPHEQALKLAGGEENLSLVTEVLIGKTFVETAELDDNRAYAAAVAAQHFAEQLLALAEGPDKRLERVSMQRWLRPLMGVLAIIALLLTVKTVVGRFVRPSDLALGKNWHASSAYPGFNFATDGKIGGPKAFDDLLFHTNPEENPWVEIDLGSTQSVRSVFVRNRKSCCVDSAIPLVVELSENRKDWVEVARRAEVFTEWNSTFSPKPAHYVRLRVPRRTALHLDSISVF